MTRTPTITPTPTFDPRCNRAAFVGDVTILDDTIFRFGEPFTKTWRIRNTGTCTWTTDYKLVFVDGDPMSGPTSVPLPTTVPPQQTVDVSVKLTAPGATGEYQGFWQLQSPQGVNFGVGGSASGRIWAKIRVIPALLATATPTPGVSPVAPVTSPIPQVSATPVWALDFAATACDAQWQSNDGVLPCPGQDGDPRGFVLTLNQAVLEDGSPASHPSLLTFPSSSVDGYILGLYPEYQVQAGDHFQASVGCEFNSTGCSVLFRLSYLDSAGAAHDLWTLGEFYDGKYFNLDLDLSQLAGQQVRLVLSVGALGSSTNDRALWVGPRVVHPQTAGPALAATSTPAPPTASVTPTLTAAPPVTPTQPPAPSPTPVPAPVKMAPSIQQIIDSIAAFFRQLLGGR